MDVYERDISATEVGTYSIVIVCSQYLNEFPFKALLENYDLFTTDYVAPIFFSAMTPGSGDGRALWGTVCVCVCVLGAKFVVRKVLIVSLI